MVAGSNPVSPTLFMQFKCYIYLLPRSPTREHLIRCGQRPSTPFASQPAWLERRTSPGERRLARRVILRPASQRQPHGETASAELVDRSDLFGQDRWIATVPNIKHRREKLDPVRAAAAASATSGSRLS